MSKEKLKIETLFIMISIFFGILFVLIIPPLQSPDEDSHFLKSYLMSQGTFLPEKVNDNVGFYLPEKLDNYIRDKQSYMGNIEKKYTYSEIYFEQLLPFSYDSVIFKDISTSKITPIAHIIPAIGIRIALINQSFDSQGIVGPAVLLQFARAFSLIIYTIIGYFAIKITPKFKKTFFTILLLPSVLFLRSTVTYDSLLVVITALSLAKMLKIYEESNYKFKKWDYILFISCGFILLNIKTVYSIVFLLMFSIPKERFGSLKGKIKSFSIMIMTVLILTILMKLLYIGLNSPTSEIVMAQIKFVTQNPFLTFKILNKNILNQIPNQFYWMVGTVGLLDTYFPVLLVNLIYFNLFIIIVTEIIEEKCCLSSWINILYIILIYLSIIAIYASMYISWTPVIVNKVGGLEITGVQGRYFIPYLFMIPFCLSNKYIKSFSLKFEKKLLYVKKVVNKYYWFFPTLTILISLFVVIERYYI